MFSVGKCILQTRTLCSSCITQYPSRLKTTRWPVISQQTKHPTWLKSPITTRCLKVKSGANHSFHPHHKWDNVPASCTLVYESGLKNYINGMYTTVAFLSVTTGTVVAVRWQNLMKNITYLDSIYLIGVMSLSLLILGIAYRFARTVIIRIYHDTDSGQFVAVRRTCLGRLRQIVYYPREVKLKQDGKLTNKDLKQSAEVKINGQDCFISANGFSAPLYYNIHLGGDDLPEDFTKSFVSDPKF